MPIRAIFEAALGPQVEQAHERWITLPSLHIMLNGAVENISLESGGSIVTERTLRDFVGAGSVGAVAVIGAPEGGVGIAAFCGGQEKGHWRTLGTSRRAIRRFASIDTAAALLRNIGVPHFQVDVMSLRPGRVRPARPDRSAALRRTRTRPSQASFPL